MFDSKVLNDEIRKKLTTGDCYLCGVRDVLCLHVKLRDNSIAATYREVHSDDPQYSELLNMERNLCMLCVQDIIAEVLIGLISDPHDKANGYKQQPEKRLKNIFHIPYDRSFKEQYFYLRDKGYPLSQISCYFDMTNEKLMEYAVEWENEENEERIERNRRA